jgi:hypothetical protein
MFDPLFKCTKLTAFQTRPQSSFRLFQPLVKLLAIQESGITRDGLIGNKHLKTR